MEPLTPRQQDILHYISDVQASRGASPLLREIAAAFSIAVGSVQDHLAALHRKGYLDVARRARRGIRLTRGKREWKVRRTWSGEFEKRFGDRLRGETDLPGLFALVREGFPAWLGAGTAALVVHDAARRAWRDESFFRANAAGAAPGAHLPGEVRDPLLDAVLRRRRSALDSPQVRDDIAHPSASPSTPGERGGSRVLAVPVLERDRVLGALRIESRELDDAVTTRAAMAAAELAPALARAALDAELRRGIRTQASLLELVRALNRSDALEPFIHSVYEIIARRIEVGYFTIAAMDDDGKWWTLLERDELDGRVWIDAKIQPAVAQRHEGVAAVRKSPFFIKHRTPEEIRVLEAKGPHVTAEGYVAAGFVHKRSRSLLYVPLRSHGVMMGHISVHSYRYNAFTVRHAEDLILIAEYVGLAVQHAWRRERERTELKELRLEVARLRKG